MRHRVLSLIGFTLGLLAILFSFPPSFMESPSFDLAVEEELVQPEAKPDEVAPTVGPVEVTASATPTATRVIASPTATATRVTTSPSPIATTTATKTITGASYSAGKYGEVQIKATVSNGVLTSVTALKYPAADSRSLSISNMAIPTLTAQTLKAVGSSDIQGVTGASYTSAAWIQSLQSIISQL
jgi:uncharacterized protein with FMN-binding domain